MVYIPMFLYTYLQMVFEPKIWGPYYWGFLHTVAHSYPHSPNEVTRRKYYDLIMNMPIFIPVPEIGDRFSEMLDKYPVTPYLVNRDSFIQWMHFIHNKYNERLGKEEVSLGEGIDQYLSLYDIQSIEFAPRINKHYIYIAFILICLILIYVYS